MYRVEQKSNGQKDGRTEGRTGPLKDVPGPRQGGCANIK
jgi:hypothetical protein